MFKGEPGTRKSTQALSFPTPQYWFSWDRKMNGMLLPMKIWGMNPKEVTFDDYDDWTKARTKLEQLQVNCPYKTIIFDSVTSCADMALRQVLKSKGIDSKKGGKQIGGITVNTIEDFGAEASALQELIALSKDISSYHKVHVILIAHVVQAEYRNTVTNETHVSRSIVTAAKRVAAKLPAYCGEVYHFNIERGFDASAGGSYTLLTEHTGDDFARTALPLPRKISFGGDKLYDKYLLPAISQLSQQSTK
jgi:hypothetical protein